MHSFLMSHWLLDALLIGAIAGVVALGVFLFRLFVACLCGAAEREHAEREAIMWRVDPEMRRASRDFDEELARLMTRGNGK